MAYDLARLEQALVNADKAGDTEAATAFASEIRKMRAVSQPEQAQEKPSNPTIFDYAFGDTTGSEYIKGRTDAIKNAFNPETWKNVIKDLGNFPEANLNGIIRAKDEPFSVSETDMSGLAMSAMPVSALSKAARAFLKPAQSAADLAKQATLNATGKAGYTLPRSNIKPSWLTNLGERFGGKQAIEATAQLKNQPVTNKLAARALGISDDVPITPELLKGLREEAGKAYFKMKSVGDLAADDAYAAALKSIKQDFSGASKDFPELANQSVGKLVKALSKRKISAEGAIEQVKNLRDAARANRAFNSSPSDKLLGKAQSKAADALDDLLGRTADRTNIGKDILNEYKTARQLIAKTYTVEKALNEGSGNVVGTQIAKQSGKVPLSGELKQIAEFSKAFPRLSREPIGGPASGGSLEPLAYGTAGHMASGNPLGAVAAGIPIIGKPIARYLMTTIPKVSSQPQNSLLANMLLQRTAMGAAGSNQANDELAKLLARQSQ